MIGGTQKQIRKKHDKTPIHNKNVSITMWKKQYYRDNSCTNLQTDVR